MLGKLANTELDVAHWDDAVAWYTDKLGLTVAYLETENRWAVLSLSEGRSGLILRGVEGLDTSVPGRVVPQIEVDDLDATISELRSRGVESLGDVNSATRQDGRSYRWVKLHDPENNLLRLYEGQV